MYLINIYKNYKLSKDDYLLLSIPLFIISFFISPSYAIIHGVFYLYIIPCVLSFYKNLDFQELYLKYKWIFLFLLFFSLSSFWSNDFEFKHFIRESKSVICLGVGVIYINLIMDRISKEILFKTLYLCSIVISFVITLNLIVFYTQNPINMRMAGYFAGGQEIKSGWLLGPVIFFMLSYFVDNKSKYNILYGLLILPLIIYIVLTQSRGPILALFIAFLLFLYQNKNTKSLVAFVSIAIAYGLYLYFVSSGSRGSSYRIEIWSHFIKEILAKPILGYGILAETSFIDNSIVGQNLFKHTHNAFLAVAFHGGIIGLGLFFKLLYDSFIVFKNNLNIKNNNKIISIIFVILSYSLVCFMTDGTLPIKSPRPIWLNFWLPILLLYYYRYKLK